MSESFAAVARRAARDAAARPLYLRLADSLAEKVASEGPDDLPSARALAGQTGLNRATVTAAYRELARRRLVVLRAGRPPRERPAPHRSLPPAEAEPPSGTLDLARYAPDRELLPAGKVFRWLGLGEGEGEAVAQYGSSWGYEPLRRWLAQRLGQHGIETAPGSLLLTSGVQHALDLLLRVLTRPGDAVVVEDPTYPGLPPLLATHQLRGEPARVGCDGVDPDVIAEAVRGSGARVAILTPTLQNPSGQVMAEDDRRRLLRQLAATGCLVVEEYFDPALITDGAAPPPLAALDAGVVAVGSFSKSLFPGLRVGWLTGPAEVVDKVAALKRATDLSGSPFLEAAAWTLCRRGVLDTQLARLREAAQERSRAVEAALARAPVGVRRSRPRGGFSMLVSLPEGWSARAVAARAARAGVWLLPGPSMSVSGRDDVVRVAFAAVGGEALERGMEKVLAALTPSRGEVPLV